MAKEAKKEEEESKEAPGEEAEDDAEEEKDTSDSDTEKEDAREGFEKSKESLDEEEVPKTVSKFEPPDIEEKERNIKKYVLIAVVSALLTLGVLGGIYFFKNYNVVDKNTATETSEMTTVSPTPEPTEEPADKEAYEIEILNGSGIAGEAALVQEDLEEEGFKVAGVGNADNTNYQETEISAKEDVSQGYLDELRAFLKKRGPVGGVKTLEDDAEVDVQIVLGPREEEPTLEP